MSETPFDTLVRPGGECLAYRRTAGKTPGIVFLGGFKSDMTGSKAVALEAFAKARGQAFLRFDYAGHGASGGTFTDGCIGDWAKDAIALLDAQTEGPQILVGSSMGGWLMLLTALARPDRVAGLVGIAAAPDFTEDLMWETFSHEVRETILRDGSYAEPSAYSDDPYIITRKLIEDGREHLLLRDPIQLHCPVRLLHGMRDPDVPWQVSVRLAEALETEDVRLSLVKDGDHRLSREQDLALLRATVGELLDG
ncbi:alpha/beta hydrolase [Oceanibaculum indicum]|uniref:alpha/beta hydrolase n=1 Tax=Oceanibaculum indicum TaxID=526216 RepID=UPI001ED9BDE0|nr:alpha/beta hydrolase [Oceanibaculum indicum]